MGTKDLDEGNNAMMTSRERMARAMGRRQLPDRVPVMCQLALGHYFLNTPFDFVDIWHDSRTFADALVMLQRRYRFDGILVNLPGRDPGWRSYIEKIDEREGHKIIHWKGGMFTVAPPDDNPHVYVADGVRYFPSFEEIEPDKLFYVEPHDLSGITYPYSWGFGGEPAPVERPDEFFPPWHWDTLKYVLEKVGTEVSVHGEIFSPFSQFVELLDVTGAMMALVEDAGKCRACLERLSEGAILLGRGHARAGAHAVLISSAFAGAGLISKSHYREFVLPFEKKVIEGIKAEFPDMPIYTHTCGAIGDRLELIEATGTDGIDTFDPPPLGDVDLADAKRRLGVRVFIKGNIDPVNTLLRGTPEQVFADARCRLEVAKPGGAYILSSACSVSPATPPENLMQLVKVAEEFGWYE